MSLKRTIQSAIARFTGRCGELAKLVTVSAKPTEEIQADLKAGKPADFMLAAGRLLASGGGASKRLEENYLFDTRRFTSGAVAAGEYIFFANAIGAPAQNNGFPAGMFMSDVETNMDTPSQIPQGKDFVLTQLGISFNADIAWGDLTLMLEIGALRFEKQGGQFTLKHGPGRFWPGGMGAAGFVAAGSNVSHGLADIRAVRRLAVPRVLRQRETFAYKYVVPRGVRNLDNSTSLSLIDNVIMTIWLWGGQRDDLPV